jgi:hypothetical protein
MTSSIMIMNDVPEDDGSIILIDYGIAKKIGTPEELKKLEELKALAKGVVTVNRQNTFDT